MSEKEKSLNFIEQIIEEDLKNRLSKDKLRFRFPPEPNGYLHVGHASAICLNFGLGLDYQAPVNLRFDDTNPAKEEQEFVDAIKADVEWLGFKWAEERYASDYFQQLYNWAVELIKKGKAYIDNQSSEEMAKQKGTPTQAGTHSPFRNRSVEENLDLFERMKNGEFPEGTHVLRDRKSTRLNSSHVRISYAVFCLKKKKTTQTSVHNSAEMRSSNPARITSSVTLLCTLHHSDVPSAPHHTHLPREHAHCAHYRHDI